MGWVCIELGIYSTQSWTPNFLQNLSGQNNHFSFWAVLKQISLIIDQLVHQGQFTLLGLKQLQSTQLNSTLDYQLSLWWLLIGLSTPIIFDI